MIVRIARVKVGNRQASYANQDPALKSGVLAFVGARFEVAPDSVAGPQWPASRYPLSSLLPSVR